MVRDGNDFVKFGLVGGGVPEDAVGAVDAEVKWVAGLAEEGAVAVGREEVKVFINVGGVVVRNTVAVGWFGSPNLGWYVNEEGLDVGEVGVNMRVVESKGR